MTAIEIGHKYRLVDPKNAYYGIVLAVSHIEDSRVVRFVNAPFPGFGFGFGVHAFKNSWVLVD